ncbi:hypothetical protein M404DRAFT_18625 [Pisolithus tinctorius Marx 270]|uniref:Uncharacterized protein n=1 Tax=Pisolithus tinctorius Marx 270 TaxID=870435 RepID=A0A0C3PGN7_PISTI|nr:hypothetical protein M404DRAFT_18625 [Pisolithus tinctorius Marx 270]
MTRTTRSYARATATKPPDGGGEPPPDENNRQKEKGPPERRALIKKRALCGPKTKRPCPESSKRQ